MDLDSDFNKTLRMTMILFVINYERALDQKSTRMKKLFTE